MTRLSLSSRMTLRARISGDICVMYTWYWSQMDSFCSHSSSGHLTSPAAATSCPARPVRMRVQE